MDIKPIQATLLSEVEQLEESLQIIKRRIKEGVPIGSHANVDASKINNLIGKYQLLVDLSNEVTEVTEPTK
jgi:hypothetical protein